MDDEKSHYISARLFIISSIAVIYILSYTGRPISDDEQLYISAARNNYINGNLGAEQLYGNMRLKGDYHGVEPAHPVLASLWLQFFHGTTFGITQTIYLLPIFYSLLSIFLVMVIAQKMGKPASVGMVAAVFFGVGSMAWPYAKTFLREPLVSALLLGSWLAYLNARSSKGYRKLFAIVLLCGLIILLILVKAPYIIVCVAYAIMFIFDACDKQQALQKGMKFIAIALAGLMVYFFLTWNMTDEHTFYRFSGGLIRDGYVHITTISHNHFLEAIFGSLFSPLKGLVFYSPVVILGLISMIRYWKQHPHLFILPISVLLNALLFQSLAFDFMWWTPTWGSRFLLPSVPLMIISSFPVIAELIEKGLPGKIILTLLLFVSTMIQLPAVLFNSSFFFSQTYNYAPDQLTSSLWDPFQSPIFLQWRLMKTKDFDLLLWRTALDKPALAFSLLIAILVFVVLSAKWFYSGYKTLPSPIIKAFWPRYLFHITTIAVFLSGLLCLGKFDPAYRIAEFKPLCDKIRQEISPDDMLIIYSYPGELWDYFFNTECGQRTWYSLTYHYYDDPNSMKYQINTQLFSHIKRDGFSRLWFISQYDTGFLSEFEQAEFTQRNYPLLDDGYFLSPIPVYYVLYEIK